MKTIYNEREFQVIDYEDGFYELKGYFKGDHATYDYLVAINVFKQKTGFRFKVALRLDDQTCLVKEVKQN